MIYPSMQQLLFAALCLIIPIAIVLSHRHPSGPIVVCSGVAFGAFAVFWLLLGGVNSPAHDAPGHILMSILTFFGGILLLLAAWVLALSAAAQAQRWGWLTLLTAATCLSALAIIFSITQPDPCIFGPPPDFIAVCPTSYPLMYWLVIASYLAGPAATLAYGLRPDGLRCSSRSFPDGLSASSLHVASDSASESAD